MASLPKIALYLTDLSGGGAERVMVNLAIGIAQAGYPLDFIVAKRQGVYFDLLPKEASLISLDSPPMLSAFKLAKYLREEKPAALLSALNQPNVASVWAKRLAGSKAKVVISVHNTLLEEAKGATNYRRKIMPAFARKFFPGADEIVAVSDDSAKANAEFLGIPLQRFTVILNPVITPALLKQAAEPLDHPWFAPGQPPVILGIGRMTFQKNFALLIEAFAKVKAKLPARLLILGEGEDRVALEAQVAALGLQDDVSMPGFVSNAYQFLGQSRVFALSSRWEGLPTVLIESLGAGTPVVSTDCPSGPKEILESGKYGRLVPIENADALAEALISELTGPKTTPPKEAYAPYLLDTVTKQYLDLLLK